MKAHEFCYWLQGYFELQANTTPKELTGGQVEVIKNHLNMVFLHDIDPKYPKKQQTELHALHANRPKEYDTDGKEILFRC